MIVVLVYRPEARDGNTFGYHAEDPFDGIEVQGIYYDAEDKGVLEIVNKMKDEHPDWHIHISTGDKIKTGANQYPQPVPSSARGKKRK